MTTPEAKAPGRKALRVICIREDDDVKVTVEPNDGDRFVVQSSKAVAALKAADREEAFMAQLNIVMNYLGKWALERNSQEGAIEAVYLTLGDGGLLAIALMRGTEYSAGLEDSLSEFDLRIANDPDLDEIRLEVMALPSVGASALEAFLHRDFRISFNCAGSQRAS